MTSEAERQSVHLAEPEGPPPLFGTWTRFYLFVVANTLATYLLLVLFSRFAR